MSKIIAIGDVIWDVYPDALVMGGATMNFAAHTSKLGADTYLVSAVGNDALGDKAIKMIESFGMTPNYIQRNNLMTGRTDVSLDEKKVPTFVVAKNVAYDHISFDEKIENLLNEQFDALYFGTVIQREEESCNTTKAIVKSGKFNEIFCDINLRKGSYNEESIKFCLENATILKISDEEEPELRKLGLYEADGDLKSIAKAISEKFSQVKLVILTLGKDGSYVYDCKAGSEYKTPAADVTAVSTVGAGDSYSAGFLVSYLKGKTIEESMKNATLLSGFVVSHTEAVPEGDIYEKLC